MMYRKVLLTLTAVMSFAASGCDDSLGDRVLEIDATGAVLGIAYVDRNGNGVLDLPADGPQANLRVQITPSGGGAAIATSITDALGAFAFRNLAVGDYRVRVDSTSVPDSLQLIGVDSAQVRVAAADSVGVLVALSFAKVSVAAARALPAGACSSKV